VYLMLNTRHILAMAESNRNQHYWRKAEQIWAIDLSSIHEITIFVISDPKSPSLVSPVHRKLSF
jgi:hypothetical protein